MCKHENAAFRIRIAADVCRLVDPKLGEGLKRRYLLFLPVVHMRVGARLEVIDGEESTGSAPLRIQKVGLRQKLEYR